MGRFLIPPRDSPRLSGCPTSPLNPGTVCRETASGPTALTPVLMAALLLPAPLTQSSVRLRRSGYSCSRLTQEQAGLSVVASPWLGSWVRWLKEGAKERGPRRNGRGEITPGFHSNGKDAGLRRVGQGMSWGQDKQWNFKTEGTSNVL